MAVVAPLAAFLLTVGLIGCSAEAPAPAPAEETAEEVVEEEDPADDIPKEHQAALKKADTYANSMHMSKAGVFDQLTADMGEQFSEEAAQYAVDNVETDWKENAYEKAVTYQDDMAMSTEAIRDQLTADFGEKFTQEEADYAVEKLSQ